MRHIEKRIQQLEANQEERVEYPSVQEWLSWQNCEPMPERVHLWYEEGPPAASNAQALQTMADFAD